MTQKIKASRYGTFLGKVSKKSKDVLQKAKDLLEKELGQKSGDKTEHTQILGKILKDLKKKSGFSRKVKEEKGTSFSLSPKELFWLEKHDSSLWLDYLIYRYQFKIYPTQHKLSNFPVHLLIEPTSICNFRCIMCFQSDDSFRQKQNMGMIPWELFTKVVDEAKKFKCRAITMASRGEPLLHPRFGDMLHYLAEAGILDIKINTNASKLDKKIAHAILSSGVSEVVFSVDAATKETYEKIRRGGKFEEVVANIDLFNKIRNKYYPHSSTVTRVQAVALSENKNDIAKMEKFWSKRIDQVVIKKAVERWDSYHRPRNNIKKPCNLLWERMYVWFDGKVNPCDFDYKSKLSFGNAKKSSLVNLWRAKTIEKIRRAHQSGNRKEIFPCNVCPINC